MPSIIDRLARNIFQKATVTYKAKVSPDTFHIKIKGDGFLGYTYTPGEHLRLFVGMDKDTALDQKLRTYSIWAHDATEGVVDIAICTHSAGIGATWVQQVAVGDMIHYMGPRDKLIIDPSGGAALMIGDASALSHLYAIRRGIPETKKVIGLIYADHKSDLYADIDGSLPFRFLQLPLHPTEQIIKEINSVRDQLPSNTIAYLAGDARLCKDIGRYLRQDLNWDSWQVKSKGFWMPGKTGMD